MSIFDSLSSMNSSGENSRNTTINSVLIGIVTNIKDPEKLGRVKLKLPLRESENETDWVRIATLMAGKEMGSFFLPEVGDEVLVAFSEGDVRKPFVIGMLWNSEEPPPEKNEDGKNNIRKFKSRNGNEIIFGDESGKEKITIHTAKGQIINMQDESNGKIEIKDQSGNNLINIDGAKNEITIQSNMKMTLKSRSCSIVIDSTQNSITIESALQLKIKAQMIDIEAGASMNIKSDGILNIKGTMVKIN